MLKPTSIALVALCMAPPVGTPKAYLAQPPETASVRPAPIAAPVVAGQSGVMIDQAGDGLFYLDGKVNGVPVRFVVDSGASLVILNAADAARAGVTASSGVSVDTAGGAKMMRRTRLQRLALAGQDLSDVEAVVVQKDLEVSLLGQSALAQMRPITFRGNRLELH